MPFLPDWITKIFSEHLHINSIKILFYGMYAIRFKPSFDYSC